MGEPIKPAKADVPITETPEFKFAVAEAARVAAAEATAAAIAHFAASQPTASDGATPSMDAQDLLRGLALAIAEMSHQGDKRDKPVDPKVLAERRAGQERMEAMFVEIASLPKNHPSVPRYKCRSRCVLHDRVIEPYKRDDATKKAVPVEFPWRLEPNDAMVPVNEMAERVYAEFRASRGNKHGKDGYAKNEVRRAIWITDKGRIIEGAPPVRREIKAENGEIDDFEIADDPFDPNASHVRVLGTSHPPARQYNADNPI